MAGLQSFSQPRWSAHVAERNTFAVIAFADETEEYEAALKPRSSSVPVSSRTRACHGRWQLMVDVKLDTSSWAVTAHQDSVDCASQADEFIETSSSAEMRQHVCAEVNSDTSTDVEKDTSSHQNDKVKSLIFEVISGGAFCDANSHAVLHVGKKSKSGRQWRPCKGARLRFKKLLKRVMDEIDNDPHGRKFKDSYFLPNTKPDLAHTQLQAVVRARLIEVLRQKDYTISEPTS